MSEDEKIIDNFKYWFETNTENGVSTIPDFICKKLLDLCQKQKEKNSKLQKRNDRQFKLLRKKDKEIQEIKDISEHDWEERCRLTFKLENYISKDKIKEKIESIENMFEVCNEEINHKLKIEDKAKIEVLKELLEEK